MKKRCLISLAVLTMAFVLTGCAGSGPSDLEISREEGIKCMKNAQYDEAISYFEAAYALCDEKMPQTKTDIALYEAACEFSKGDYEALKAVCTKIIDLNDSAEARYLRGTAYIKTGDTDTAIAEFDRAAELNPYDYEMFLNMYKQFEDISQSAVGDIYIQKALAIPNETMDDQYQKGYIYYYLKDYTKALEALAEPVQEHHEKATLLMGQAYLALDDNAHARNIYQQYVEEFGATATAYNGLTLCDLADNAYDTALADISSGLQADPSDEIRRELLYNEIIVYEMKRDFSTAKAKAADFVQNYPNDEDGKRENAFLSTR